MVSTNFVVDRCENTSFQGGGGGWEKWKRFLSEIYITSPDHLYCIILLLNCSEVLSILCVFFRFSLIRSEIDKPLGFDRDFDI